MSRGHLAGVPAKNALFCQFSKRKTDRKSLGHRPVDPCLSRRVSQGHPAGVPGLFLKFMFTVVAVIITVLIPRNYMAVTLLITVL